MSRRLPRFLSDPLLMFVVLGGGCFGLYAEFHEEKTVIAVTEAARRSLADDYELLNGERPDQAAMDQLVERYVTDEILFQEALDRQLLLNDHKTKQRMIEKMRFLLSDPPDEPTEAQQIEFYADHHDGYRSERRLDFHQIYFKTLPARPEAVLARLIAGEPITGDDLWLGTELRHSSDSMTRAVLGNDFVNALYQAPRGQWSGPLRSDRGLHFVRLLAVHEPELIPFPEVREQVVQDWIADQREQSLKRRLAALRERYAVENR